MNEPRERAEDRQLFRPNDRKRAFDIQGGSRRQIDTRRS
jgi:hypothetical protein